MSRSVLSILKTFKFVTYILIKVQNHQYTADTKIVSEEEKKSNKQFVAR